MLLNLRQPTDTMPLIATVPWSELVNDASAVTGNAWHTPLWERSLVKGMMQ